MKRKVLSILTILVMIIGITTIVEAVEIGETISIYGKLGDVDRDGKITEKDAELVLKYITGQKRLNILQKKRADVDRDGRITSTDAVKIEMYINEPQKEEVKVESLTITGEKEVYVGEVINLKAVVYPNNTGEKVEWSTSNKLRATVDENGNVKGVKKGSVTITAKVGEITARQTVEVKEKEKTITSMRISKSPDKVNYSLDQNIDTKGLELEVTYSDGSTDKVKSGFEYSPKKVEKTGKQDITITYKGKIAKYTIEVGALKQNSSVKIDIFSDSDSIKIDKYKSVLNEKNDDWRITFKCSPINNDTVNVSKGYESNGAVALYYANRMLGANIDTKYLKDNYYVRENGKVISWRTNWTAGNYKCQEFNTYAEEIRTIIQEILWGNPIPVAVMDVNGNFRYVVAYAIDKPSKTYPEYKAENILVVDPVDGKWRTLASYYQFTEGGKVIYRIQNLSREAVKSIEMNGTASIEKGKTTTLKVNKYINTAGLEMKIPKLQKIKWTSSNTSVATVDENTGKVTAKSKGTATITAVAYYSKNKSTKATCKITVGESFEGVELKYSAAYNVSSNPLTKRKGVVYFNGHKETYYSQKVLPGSGLTELNNNGRHVADDGTIRDKDGYIAVACNYLSKGTKIMTSLGPGKVYDTGDMTGKWIDIYVNW